MAQINRETIERIIDENDIVEVVGGYLPLKRAGTNFRALCPFHTEKTPSFNVNPHRQIFHCFGCQAGGDVIRFVMDYENLPFPDAARKLAERAGILIAEEAFDPREEARRRMRRELQTLQRKAAEWFHHLLFKKPFAQPARDYLKGRGLSMDTARKWQFGYAPESGGLLFDWAREAGYSVKHLVEGGLASWRDENRPDQGAYSRFRHRLMFPVCNEMGDVIAFSGRLLNPEQKGGKYVNSPETILFNKSKTLFGFNQSKRAVLRESRVIVVEGQLDMIAAFEAGVENIVAPLGTAFTPQHARILKRNAGEVILCFDSDDAGYGAVVKAFQQLARAGVFVKVGMLPAGEDPDSLIRSGGIEALQEILDSAPDYFDFLIDRQSSRRNLESLRDRLNFARELSVNIALVEDKMLQDSLINRVITKLGVGETDIRRLVRDAKKAADRSDRAARRSEAAEARRSAGARNGENGAPDPIQPAQQGSVTDLTQLNKSVKFLCQLLLNDADARNTLTASPPPEFLKSVPDTELLARIWEADIDPSSAVSVSAFTAQLPSGEQNCVAGLLNTAVPDTGAEDLAHECLQSLRRQSLQNRIREIRARLKDPQLQAGDVDSLTKQLLDLNSELHDIPAPPNGGS